MSLQTILQPMRSEFGQRLYEARKFAKKSQTQVAAAVGMAQGTLGGLEREGQGSSYTVEIAKFLRVSPEWLSTGDGEMLVSGATITAPTGMLVASGGPDYAKQLTILFNGLPTEVRLQAFNAVLPVLLGFLPEQTESKKPLPHQSGVVKKQIL